MDNYLELCHSLPKIELHAHLNGSLSSDTLKKLSCLDVNIEKYKRFVKILNKTDKTLNECFEVFQIGQNAANNCKSLYIATKDIIKDFYDDNVIYLELRTTPRSENNMNKNEYIETVVNAINDNKFDILVKLIISIDRQKGIDDETIRTIINMKNKYPDIIKGVDFSGNPHCNDFDNNLFEMFRYNNFKTTIHCAEIKNNIEIKKILEFKPERLGHGTCLHPNYGGCIENWQLYKELKIPMEICLTSNIVCGTITHYKNHHLKQWIDNKLPFNINTDDKGVFCTSLSREYSFLMKYFNLNLKELNNISYDAINYSFASDMEKQILIEKLTNSIKQII